MKFSLLLLSLSTLLMAGDFATIFMSSTLFILLATLAVALSYHLKKLQSDNLKQHALFEYTDVPTLLINSKNEIIEVNQSALTLTGYKRGQLLRSKWYEKLLPDENALQARHQLHKALKEDARTAFTSQLIRANTKVLEVHYTLTKLPPPHISSVMTLLDITQKQALKNELISVQEHLVETRHALEQLGEQFKATFDIAINGIALLDDQGAMIYLNRALIDMFEYNEDYMKHLGLNLLVNDPESVQLLLKTVKNGEKIDKMQISSFTRHGDKLDIDLTMGYLDDLEQYYIVAQDITKTLAYTAELKRSKKRLEQRVIKDPLTGAYNRIYLEDKLDELMQEEESFGFILVDIDHFKKVNDSCGHLVGDAVLVNLVEALREKLRGGDTLARYGGEEFIIILPRASHEQSLAIARKLQEYIEQLSFNSCPAITCSFGVESFNGSQDKKALFSAADKALYQAKYNGRNCVVDAHSLESDYNI